MMLSRYCSSNVSDYFLTFTTLLLYKGSERTHRVDSRFDLQQIQKEGGTYEIYIKKQPIYLFIYSNHS